MPQLSKDVADTLHRFFSPYKVPEEMTAEEIQACIDLFPRRDKVSRHFLEIRRRKIFDAWVKALESNYLLLERHREGYSRVWGDTAWDLTPEKIAHFNSEADVFTYYPIPLPPELTHGPMTRKNFCRGIAIVMTQVNQLEGRLRQGSGQD